MMIFDTIHWLPEHLAKMKEWQQICNAYDHLLSKAFSDVDEIYANQFIDSLTEIGCLIWERLLGVAVDPGATIESRRQSIKSFFVGDLPYTENKLKEALKNIAGSNAVKLKVTQGKYEIKIDLTISTPSVLSNIENIVYKMRPCNMIVRICIRYERENEVFVGHAVKQNKTISPSAPQGDNPIKTLTWVVDNDEALLVDENGSAFVI